MRSDVIVWMTEAADDSARHELARLPGVIAVESGRDVPVRFVNGHLSQRSQIQGFARDPELRRVIDIDQREASRLERSAPKQAAALRRVARLIALN